MWKPMETWTQEMSMISREKSKCECFCWFEANIGEKMTEMWERFSEQRSLYPTAFLPSFTPGGCIIAHLQSKISATRGGGWGLLVVVSGWERITFSHCAPRPTHTHWFSLLANGFASGKKTKKTNCQPPPTNPHPHPLPLSGKLYFGHFYFINHRHCWFIHD